MKLPAIRQIAVLTVCFLSLNASAETNDKAVSAGLGGGAVIGAIAAGPVGAIVGAALGAHYADTASRAGQVPVLQASLEQSRGEISNSESRIARLNRSLFDTRSELEKLGDEMGQLLLERAVFEGLQMEVMYPTAAAELTPAASARLERLAALLNKLPEMTVQLEGFADPRGDDEYNLDLSRQRAEAVREALVASGVAESRISLQAHGELTSTAGDGDLDAYALDRRVRIRLLNSADAARVAAQD